ncbi:hypothetical protein [Actinoplanes sp. NPDC020271]|uniref:hypothetical protein n=1 Tax=Actinoplanes sp. NPDC020271 TaxID=3363896 RepID=UPI00378C8F92
MTDEEIAARIRQERPGAVTTAVIGGHDVLIDTVRRPGGEVTTVHRVRDGRVTVLRAGAGSFREDVARVLLDVPPVATGTIQPVAVELPGVRLDRALVLGLDPVADSSGGRGDARGGPGESGNGPEVTVVAVHRSEIRVGESEKEFHGAISSHGTGLAHRLDNWDRHPVPRADARLLDDWPGGVMRRSQRFHPWQAERMLTAVAPDGPAGVRVEVRSMAGHTLVLERRWDRGTGTLTFPDGATVPVDLPRRELWARLGPLFRGEPGEPVTVVAGTPEPDVLELRYQTEDRGWASLPRMESVGDCVARLDRQIRRTPGSWAVFTSRSDAVIQVECTDDGDLWLETPDPATKQSRGRVVTVAEAAGLLEILAREDRSAVDELPGAQTVDWD